MKRRRDGEGEMSEEEEGLGEGEEGGEEGERRRGTEMIERRWRHGRLSLLSR